MTCENVDLFAENLIRLVRDRAIRNCSSNVGPGPKSPIGRHWTTALVRSNIDSIRDVIIPDCVDEVIWCLLNAIDKEELELLFVAPDGQMVDLCKDGLGELGGWYMGNDQGWRQRFSREKFIDYLR